MELDLCVSGNSWGLIKWRPRLLEKAISGGSTRNAQDCSTFVANVVCPEAALDSATRDRVERMLAGDGFSSFFSPSSHSRLELLLRSRHCHDSPRGRSVHRTLGSPRRLRSALVVPSSSLRLNACLSLLPGIPEPLCIGINAGPGTFGSPELLAPLTAACRAGSSSNSTEHVGIEDYPRLRRASKALRHIGSRVALDDTGTAANLKPVPVSSSATLLPICRRALDARRSLG